MEIYEPVIFRLAKRKNLQDADVREIVQEVLMRVAGAIDRFDPYGAGSFRGWLSKTTRRVAVDRFRRLAGRETAIGGVTPELESVLQTAAGQLDAEFDLEHRRQLFRCAAEHIRPIVSQSTWAAFWETAVKDRPACDVASDLGLSDGAVYVARCRVLKRIREFIETREAE